VLAREITDFAASKIVYVACGGGIVWVQVRCRRGAVAILRHRLCVKMVAERALILWQVLELNLEHDTITVDPWRGRYGGLNVSVDCGLVDGARRIARNL
jgi:hypothetical protein